MLTQRFGTANLTGGSAGTAGALAGEGRGAGITNASPIVGEDAAGGGVGSGGVVAGNAAKPRSSSSVTLRSRAVACSLPIVTTITRRPFRSAVAERQNPAPLVKPVLSP